MNSGSSLTIDSFTSDRITGNPVLRHIVKVLIDYTLALMGIIFLFPFVLMYSLFIFILLQENPFYIQKRSIGKPNQKLKVYKLRTLKSSAIIHQKNHHSLKKNISGNCYLPCGKFLRKTGLDEILQLINVLLGQMSIIGPRPLMLDDIEFIRKNNPHIIEQRKCLKSKPGISGYWQVFRDSEFDLEEMIKHDKYYETNQSLMLDCKLLVKTIKKVLTMNHTDTIE